MYSSHKNEASSARKPSVNSNKASMSFELCAYQYEIKYGGEDTFRIGKSSGKSAMIISNPPNLQILDKTRVLRAWQPINQNKIH